MRTDKFTQVEGWEIVHREAAVAPHPHPSQNGKLVPFAGITRVLAVDPTGNSHDGVECDECGVIYWAETDSEADMVAAAGSTRSHRTAHITPRGPLYPKETIALVVRLVRQQERDGRLKDKCAVVAAELNRRQVETVGGGDWNGGMVSRIFNRYKNKVHVRLPKARAAGGDTSPDDGKAATREVRERALSPDEISEALLKAFERTLFATAELTRLLKSAGPAFSRLQEQLNAAREAKARVDPELERAVAVLRRRGLLGG